MRKIFISAWVALLGFTSAFADKGDKALGGQVVDFLDDGTVGLGVRGLYSFTDNWRGEGSFNYYFISIGSLIQLNANLHYVCPLGDKFEAYPLAGLALTRFAYNELSATKLGLNLGGGLGCHLTSKIDLNANIHWLFISSINTVTASAGLMFKL